MNDQANVTFTGKPQSERRIFNPVKEASNQWFKFLHRPIKKKVDSLLFVIRNFLVTITLSYQKYVNLFYFGKRKKSVDTHI